MKLFLRLHMVRIEVTVLPAAWMHTHGHTSQYVNDRCKTYNIYSLSLSFFSFSTCIGLYLPWKQLRFFNFRKGLVSSSSALDIGGKDVLERVLTGALCSLGCSWECSWVPGCGSPRWCRCRCTEPGTRWHGGRTGRHTGAVPTSMPNSFSWACWPTAL